MVVVHLVGLMLLLLAGGGVLVLLRVLRREGLRDRAAEAVTVTIMLYSVAHAALAIAWPDRLAWVKLSVPVPPLLAVAGLCIHRIRQLPEGLFPPETFRWFSSLRNRIRQLPEEMFPPKTLHWFRSLRRHR
jgi:hypothetical protein